MEFTCYRPPGMCPVLQLPDVVFRQVAQRGADLALASGEPVTVLGVYLTAPVLCQEPCHLHHPDSIVIMPDVMLVELFANGQLFEGDVTVQVIRRSDSRSVRIYRTAGTSPR
jgi:hypothetical protein